MTLTMARRAAVLAVLVLVGCRSVAEPRAIVGRTARPSAITSSPPPELLRALRQLTVREDGMCASEDWTLPAALGSEEYAELDGLALLVFLQVPNHFCHDSNLALPVLVDGVGRWRWGRPLDGVVSALVRGPDRTLWAVSHWVVEANVPHLWRSTDGLTWQAVARPGKENPTSLFVTRLCIHGGELQIQLQDRDSEQPDQTEVWSAPLSQLRSSPSSQRSWRPIDGRGVSCVHVGARGSWRREVAGPGRITFRRGDHEVRLPQTLSRTDTDTALRVVPTIRGGT